MAFPDDDLPLTFQLRLGGVWVPVIPAPDGEEPGPDYRLLEQLVTVSRGTADEMSNASPAQVQVQLWNGDGRLTPGMWVDATGEVNPWCPEWDEGVQIRALLGSKVRFHGDISEIHPEWPEGDVEEDGSTALLDEDGAPLLDEDDDVLMDEGPDTGGTGIAFVAVTGSGVLRNLGIADVLRSALYRQVTGPVILPHLHGYFPMEDDKDATSISSGIPGAVDPVWWTPDSGMSPEEGGPCGSSCEVPAGVSS